MIVLLYVDDMIVSGNDEKEIAKLRSDPISIQFEMKELGKLSDFLGLEVENLNDGIIFYSKGAMLEIWLKV